MESQKNFKARFKKGAKWFGLLFILMFVLRMLYGYLGISGSDGLNLYQPNASDDNYFSSMGDLRKNYASEKIAYKDNTAFAQQPSASSQKFEKTASIRTVSNDFDNEEKKAREQVKSFNAVIQYEQNVGLKGSRELHLMIGVNPQSFDQFYDEVQKIGTVKAMEISKVDKTNEYRQLNAKKVSIEKTLAALNELKSKGGQIADFVTLSERILEVEGQLQELGVELGNFDEVNEFCTVRLSMYEGNIKPISFIHRVKVAFEWTVSYYLRLAFALMLISVFIFLFLLIVDKLKLITKINDKINN